MICGLLFSIFCNGHILWIGYKVSGERKLRSFRLFRGVILAVEAQSGNALRNGDGDMGGRGELACRHLVHTS